MKGFFKKYWSHIVVAFASATFAWFIATRSGHSRLPALAPIHWHWRAAGFILITTVAIVGIVYILFRKPTVRTHVLAFGKWVWGEVWGKIKQGFVWLKARRKILVIGIITTIIVTVALLSHPVIDIPWSTIGLVALLIGSAIVCIGLGILAYKRRSAFSASMSSKSFAPLYVLIGLAFFDIVVSQTAEDFWFEWIQIPGFWAIQGGFILTAILWLFRGVAPRLIGFIILIVSLCFTCSTAIRAERAKRARQVAAIIRVTPPTGAPAPVTARQWVYGFMKPPGVQGLRPWVRTNSFPAKIVYYDDARFDFDIYLSQVGVDHYNWLRRDPYGTWARPDNSNRGTWYLEPEQPGPNPTSFRGWETNIRGEKMFIWLQATN